MTIQEIDKRIIMEFIEKFAMGMQIPMTMPWYHQEVPLLPYG
jgi:hypothetical protein